MGGDIIQPINEPRALEMSLVLVKSVKNLVLRPRFTDSESTCHESEDTWVL